MNYDLHKLANEIIGIERTHIINTNYKLRILKLDTCNVKVLNSSNVIQRPTNSTDTVIQYNLETDSYKIIIYDITGEVYYSEDIIVTDDMYNTIYTLNTIKGVDE